jgi:hypothetical protein
MKRVINIDNQIIDGERSFAIYDTVRDCFDKVNGSHTWQTADELSKDYDADLEDITASANITMTSERKKRMQEDKGRCVALARSAGY